MSEVFVKLKEITQIINAAKIFTKPKTKWTKHAASISDN